MSRLLQLIIVAALFTISFAAEATVDGGATLRLLAIAGPNERFAILAEEDVQGGCTAMGCVVFAVDVAAGSRRRLHEHRLSLQAPSPPGTAPPRVTSLLLRYLNNLDEGARRHLSPVRDASKHALKSPDALAASGRKDPNRWGKVVPSLRFSLSAKQRLQVMLQHSAPFTAAALYDRRSTSDDSAGDWRACIDMKRQQAMCSSCRQISLQVDGVLRKVWSCPGLGRYSGAKKGAETCDCRARGRISTLRLRHTPSGASWRGSSILAVPGAMGQNWVSNGDDITLDFGLPQQGSDLQVVQLRSGLLAFGSVSNARFANGTFIPVFATAPQLASKSRLARRAPSAR